MPSSISRRRYWREYYRKNREKICERRKKWDAAHRDRIKLLSHNRWLERRKNPEILFTRYKQNARRRKHDFTLSTKDFKRLWSKPCHYCGDPINTIGIDRRDNTKGYVYSNCLPCCRSCNIAKNTLSYSDFMSKARKIARKHRIA